jgi:hypothetical protein
MLATHIASSDRGESPPHWEEAGEPTFVPSTSRVDSATYLKPPMPGGLSGPLSAPPPAPGEGEGEG